MTNIHYVGCDASHLGSSVFDIPEGHDCWLLLITQTPALFWINGEIKEYLMHGTHSISEVAALWGYNNV